MNAMYLKDLADKTRRGLKGSALKKANPAAVWLMATKSPQKHTAAGEAIRGEREIDEFQAEIVRRIFP
jgi:site-specific DNA recombinase